MKSRVTSSGRRGVSEACVNGVSDDPGICTFFGAIISGSGDFSFSFGGASSGFAICGKLIWGGVGLGTCCFCCNVSGRTNWEAIMAGS